MRRKKKKQKLQNKKINYQKKLVELFKKKSSYFFVGLSVLIFLFYFLFKTKIHPYKEIVNRKSSQKKIEKTTHTKKERIYQVKEGDTLWLIAEKFYGSGFNMEDIMRTNNIIDPNKIEKGQILIIPSVKPKSPTQGEIDNHQTKKVEEAKKNYHIVQLGDDLWQIALKNYGDGYAWPRIAEANNLINPNIIEPGRKLIIPR